MSERFTRDHIKRKRDEHAAKAEEKLDANAKVDEFVTEFRKVTAVEANAHATLAIYYDNRLR